MAGRRVAGARAVPAAALLLGLGCAGIEGWQAERKETARAAAEEDTFRAALADGEVVAELWEKKPCAPPLPPPGTTDSIAPGGRWSEHVNGLKARLVVVRGEVRHGTPVLDTYVELHNSSGRARPLILRWQKADLEWTVTDAAGAKVAPNGSAAGNETSSGTEPPPLVIPADATLRVRVTRTWSGIKPNSGAHLDVMPCWWFERGDRARYFMAGTVTVPAGRKGEWAGTLVLPKAEIPVAGAS
ncbi:hypothetical protein J0H58_37120 [bacterium]|nr:hypothetical protein [bacterium]